MFYLKQFNNFIKKFNFEFGHCCICNENKFIHELIICDISNFEFELKHMKILFKMNSRFHFEYNIEFIQEELLNDTKHVHPKLEGFLLSNQGISTTKHQFSTCKTCYISLKNNKMLKLALANGLWIGITPKILPKLTMVGKTLITCYRCCTILVKLRYTNKGSTTCQHALKGNVVNFAQDLESVVKLLDTLPSPLESLSNTIAIHFVGSSHPPVELVKSFKLLHVHKSIVIVWLTWLKMNHIGYKNITMNMDFLNMLPENDILKPIMRSMF
jgi:hypothetical protein